MNDGHTQQYPVAIPATPEEVITFVGQNFTHEYRNGWDGKPADPIYVRYEVSVEQLLASFKGLADATVRANIDIEAFAWAYKALTKNGEQDHPMMDRLGTALGGLGHE